MANQAGLISVSLINSLIVIVSVLTHYECLVRLSGLIAGIRFRHRFRLIVAVVGVLIGHVIQVWLFASAYFFMHAAEGWGRLAGNFSGSFIDCVYFSFTTFTTLGYGDIQPLGALRYLTGIEALTGLVLITWSASFLFVEMQRYWTER
ncbi:potassium channel family protein [Hydrocarboniclastica marina]|uniref:Two pore domain potassium channel family protein n=1 Tax=Hydrocarboniclastica marina TaxID=2259620 RepID=A0A4P7XG98_9ALTE|nr:potassium channel family protein [Hydrocarboniclastica marina]MAL97046.1 ion transporter [Alteromonadaceae bacterium]QCF25464.1 two pore domain potassium channel family protein [Hydrocarboniclastica marina]